MGKIIGFFILSIIFAVPLFAQFEENGVSLLTPELQWRLSVSSWNTRNYDDAAVEFLFRARGLDPGSRYEVSFDNESYTVEMSGGDIMNAGIAVRLERALSSQMLVVKAK